MNDIKNEVFQKAIVEWMRSRPNCIRCEAEVSSIDEYVAGVFFPETMDTEGPQEFAPEAVVVPYCLCSNCIEHNEHGEWDVSATQDIIDLSLGKMILEGGLHSLSKITARAFTRDVMYKTVLN